MSNSLYCSLKIEERKQKKSFEEESTIHSEPIKKSYWLGIKNKFRKILKIFTA